MSFRWSSAVAAVVVCALTSPVAFAQSDRLLEAVRLHSPGARAQAEIELRACEANACDARSRLGLLAGYLALSEGDAARAAELFSAHPPPAGLEPWHTYYSGQAAFYRRDYEQAARHFERAAKIAPASLKGRAQARIGEAYLAANNPAAAVKPLEEAASASGSVELLHQRALARQATGNLDGARADWITLAVRFAAHPFGEDATARLSKLKPAYKFSFDERVKRARALLDGSKPDAALAEIVAIEQQKLARGATAQANVAFVRALALYAKGQDADGDAWLDKAMKGPKSLAAEALMVRARRALKKERPKARQLMGELAKKYPKEAPADDALYLAAWLDLQMDHYAEAVKTFELFEKQHPSSRKLDEALWFKALAQLRMEKYADVQATLGALQQRFPRSSLVPQAKYWTARAAQLSGAKAEVLSPQYTFVVQQFPGSFYALMSQVRLKELGIEPPPAFPTKPSVLEQSVPKELERAVTLSRAGLFRDATAEVEAQLALVRNATSALHFGHALAQIGEFGSAYALASRHLWGPAYSEKKPEAVALLYPRAYRAAVEREAERQKIPAWFVWAIMRRESAFRPEVYSPADARGLMQIIPPTATAIARELGDEAPPPDALYAPEVNIRYGAWYLGRLWERFSHPALAAAAYNAGPPAVLDWVKADRELPLDLFVELIPYRETRGYVKQVVADFHLYQALYADGARVESVGMSLPEPRAEGVNF